MGRWLIRAVRAVLAVVVAVTMGLIGAAPAHAAGGFYDGVVQYSSVLNCVSIIQGAPYSEKGVGVYVGSYADPTAGVPGVGQTFYIHVVAYGMGNTCSGQRVVPAFQLPSGVSLDTTQPILCFVSTGQAVGSDCPQYGNLVPSSIGGQYMYMSTDGANANTWPLPTGKFWEFRFPVVSSSTQTGAPLNGFVKVFDGNSSPILTPSSGLYVFGAASPPSIIYSAPSTVARLLAPDNTTVPGYGVVSTANFYTNSLAGEGAFDIGTAPGTYTGHVGLAIPNTGSNWLVWTDWTDPGMPVLTPGATYYWRATFTPTGGATVYGAEQRLDMPLALTCGGHKITVALSLGQVPTAGPDVVMGTNGADSISADDGDDVVCGMGGNDVIDGGAGNDVIDGGAGTDTVSYASATAGISVNLGVVGPQNTVSSGTDTISTVENVDGSPHSDNISGGAGPNVLVGGAGDDTIAGGDGNDTLNGGPGNDTLHGGVGNDMVNGGDGNDTLTGDDGSDYLLGGLGDDTINGGAGMDTVSYGDAPSAVTVNLTLTGAQNTGGAGLDTLAGIENLSGSRFNDVLTGDAGPNQVFGGAGNDTVAGGAGNDQVSGGAGNDMMNCGTGSDFASYSDSTAAVTVSLALSGTAQNTVGAGTDTLSGCENLAGSKYGDTLTGDGGNNVFSGGAGDDRVDGGAGNDYLMGGAGNDTLIGGLGTDAAAYADATAGVVVSLAVTTTQNTGGAGTDTLSGIEGLNGSPFADTLTGDAGANQFSAGAGNDIVTGGAGDDLMIGGAGNDTLVGGDGVDTASYADATTGVTVNLTVTTAQNTVSSGSDTLSTIENLSGSRYADSLTGNAAANTLLGLAGNDVLDGGDGNDYLYGGVGNDTILGGSGVDTAGYGDATSGVTVSLATTAAQATGGSGTDTLSAVENLSGSAYADVLTGSSANNTLNGGAGADSLNGGAGTDTCNGGADTDTALNCEVTTGIP